MVTFSYEILAATLFIVFLVMLSSEYLWLYILSRKQEEAVKQRAEINARVHSMMEAVLASPTDSAREAETNSLLQYLDDDYEKKDEAAIQILQLNRRQEALSEGKLTSLSRIYAAVDPIRLYSEKLKNGKCDEKGYACRQLADFGAVEETESIRKLLEEKDRRLVYNAAMALSELGDEESVITFAHKCESIRKYSHRVLLELLQSYTGDRESLVRKLFGECNNYIKATAIKAYSSSSIHSLADLYIENMESKDAQLKIAAVKAVSELGDERFTHRLITALNDKNWIVRLSAVHGLEKIGSEKALEAIVGAVQDDEWWVRKAAAEAIVKIDYDLTYIEKVLSGYDKYAADAVKNALYKAIRMNGGQIR